jgi:hypothetical protein
MPENALKCSLAREKHEECWIMLVERASTKHTGDVQTSMTRTLEQQLA